MHIAHVEAEGGPASRIVGRDLLALGIHLDLEEGFVTPVDASVVVPVMAPARQAQIEREVAVVAGGRKVLLDDAQVSQLETGMTRSQVMYLLGTPMVPNGFNTDRWDYFYYIKVGRGSLTATRKLTVWFKDDKVERIEGDAASAAKKIITPAEAEAASS